jgi:hypothetical protein
MRNRLAKPVLYLSTGLIIGTFLWQICLGLCPVP